MSKAITIDQMCQLAAKYGLHLADLQTIREVETAGSGFLADGRPKILFERHWFSRMTGGVFDISHPDISNKKAGGYKGGAGEWVRFDKAQKLNREAAIKSTSWGAGQVMGDHYKNLGFATPQEFLTANFQDEATQLDIMLKFITRNPSMYAALKGRKWTTFAKMYNGPKYAENQYDTKLAAAFKKHSSATV